MGREKEPLDSLTAGRPASGIHLVATAALIAKDATREELDLASLILRRDPARAAARENESIVEAFNRLLDVAIDSANDSTHCGSRAERRALMCQDLGRKGVVLIDCSTLAELVEAKLELDGIKLGLVVEPPGPIPLLEALEDAELSDEEIFEQLGCCNPCCRALVGAGYCPDCGKGGEPELEEEEIEELARVRSAPFAAEHYSLESNPGVADRYGKLPAGYFNRVKRYSTPEINRICGIDEFPEADGNGGSYNGLEFMGGDRHSDFNPSVND